MDFSQLQLAPYHLPEPVSWWPPALGWWLIAGLILCTLMSVLFFVVHWRRQKWRRAAKKELTMLQTQYQAEQLTSHDLARQLSQLLRRICLTRFADQHIAGYTGETWLCTLEHLSRNKVVFNSKTGRTLLQAAYSTKVKADETHIALCRRWVKYLPAAPVFPLFIRRKKTQEKKHV